jgi:restriction system protein
MARRKSGALKDLFEISCMLPWWGGLVLAIASYTILHSYAVQEAVIEVNSGSAIKGINIYKMLATPAQYIIPGALLAGALVSFIGKIRRERLFENSAVSSSPTVLNEQSWQEFEMLVGEAFRLRGFSVRETGGGGADGGVDLVISKDNRSYLVQCKQWKSQQVGVKIVRELAGLVAAKGVEGGVVVTSGSYTKEAVSFSRESGIKLIDGKQLHGFIKGIAAGAGKTGEQEVATGAPAKVQETVCCPKCGSEMIKRVASRGVNQGRQFLGCARYPACRGIRDHSSLV